MHHDNDGISVCAGGRSPPSRGGTAEPGAARAGGTTHRGIGGGADDAERPDLSDAPQHPGARERHRSRLRQQHPRLVPPHDRPYPPKTSGGEAASTTPPPPTY